MSHHVFSCLNLIRIFNKYVRNRLFRGFANLPHGPFAIIGHVGRRRGKPYETVIWVWPLEEGFVIALTYGPQLVDWYRNLLAAGGGTVFWHRRLYAVGKLEQIDDETARPSFPRAFPADLSHSFGRQQEFVQVKSSAPESVRT